MEHLLEKSFEDLVSGIHFNCLELLYRSQTLFHEEQSVIHSTAEGAVVDSRVAASQAQVLENKMRSSPDLLPLQPGDGVAPSIENYYSFLSAEDATESNLEAEFERMYNSARRSRVAADDDKWVYRKCHEMFKSIEFAPEMASVALSKGACALCHRTEGVPLTSNRAIKIDVTPIELGNCSKVWVHSTCLAWSSISHDQDFIQVPWS